MRKCNGNNGSELHRLKPMQDYDEAMFNRLYKVCKPVIRNLTKQIDYKRFNLTPDIISSYFWDKMLFVFNKYYGTCSEEHLKARILSSLATFKNKLLRFAYGEIAEYNQNLFKLEDLFDNDKELEDDDEEVKADSPVSEDMYIGDSKADNYLRTYSQALIQKNDDDEFTILSIAAAAAIAGLTKCVRPPAP